MFFSSSVVSLLIYYISSALCVYSTFKRVNYRCSQRLQCFRKSIVCNISWMCEGFLSGEPVCSVCAELKSKDLVELKRVHSSLH